MSAYLVVAGWVVAIQGALLIAVVIAVLKPPRTPQAVVRVPCPCCTGRPMEFSDCTCREDCGCGWCQAADPECPWCDDPGVIDSTRCNCPQPCPVGICKARDPIEAEYRKLLAEERRRG